MKYSLLKLRGSLYPAILLAACLLGLLMVQGWAGDGQTTVGPAQGEAESLGRSVETIMR